MIRQEYYAEIIADSEINNNRVTTFEITFPRFVAEQLLTHAMLRRNAGSLRATPTHKILAAATASPLSYRANQPGMQAGAVLGGWRALAARSSWALARAGAVLGSRGLVWAGVHKEIANRPLIPFLWQTFVITSNRYGWENFFAQRCSEHAQPELNYIASVMRASYEQNRPAPVIHHVPYDPLFDKNWHIEYQNINSDRYFRARFNKIAVARIARVSRFNHGLNKIDYDKDIALYEDLKNKQHYSPFDHVLTYDKNFVNGIFPGWKSLREELFPQFIQER